MAIKTEDILGDIDARTAWRLIEAASDISLVLDMRGTILDVSIQDPEFARATGHGWRGKPWTDTVGADSHEKIEALLRGAVAGEPARWRQVNHPVSGAEDVPVIYTAVRVHDPAAPSAGDPRIVAFGRDLRSTVLLQRRLVEAQQAMERDYWRFREAETRYRNLFQTSQEAVLVIDGQSQKVLEANPAAETLVDRPGLRLVGVALPSLFDAVDAEPLQALLAAARTVGKRDPVRLRLAQGKGEVEAAASVFRQDQAPFVLLRLAPISPVMPAGAAAGRNEGTLALALLDAYARNSPDGLVFTDAQGRVLSANRAFATLAQLSAEDQARGEMLDRWLGRTGVEMGVLITNLRQRGSVGLFTTTLRGEYGAVLEVEISASPVGSPEPQALAFAVRDIGRRLQGGGEDRAPAKLARSPGELTELVGRVPMKDIVSETTDLIEQLCIETALQMTQDNRALAAQLLGLSRQSLYVKLRRYGLGDLSSDG